MRATSSPCGPQDAAGYKGERALQPEGRQEGTHHAKRGLRGVMAIVRGEGGEPPGQQPVAAVASRTRRARVLRFSQTSFRKSTALPRGRP